MGNNRSPTAISLIPLKELMTGEDVESSKDPPTIGSVDLTPLRFLSDSIVFGSLYLVYPGDCFNPGFFHVNSLDTWWKFNQLVEDMQEWYKDIHIIPTKEYLIPGTHVAALYGEETEDKEFCRGKVLKPSEEDDVFMVFLFDYGRVMDVPRKNIRYLDHFFLNRLPAQAIRCRAILGWGQEASQNMTWTPEETERFQDMVRDQTLAVRFLQGDTVLGEAVWEVFIPIYDEQKKKISQFHIERQFLQDTRGVEFTDEELRRRHIFTTDKNPKAKLDLLTKEKFKLKEEK